MKSLIPQKSPELLLEPLDNGYAYAVNCSFPNSFSLLNHRQYEILQAVDDIDDVQTIVDKFELKNETLQDFLMLLNKTEIVVS